MCSENCVVVVFLHTCGLGQKPWALVIDRQQSVLASIQPALKEPRRGGGCSWPSASGRRAPSPTPRPWLPTRPWETWGGDEPSGAAVPALIVPGGQWLHVRWRVDCSEVALHVSC